MNNINPTQVTVPSWLGPIPQDEPKSLSDTCGRMVDVVLIAAVETELDAVLRLLKPFPDEQCIWRVVRDGRTYYMGRYGKHDVVVTMCTMGYAGKGGAARTTAKAILGWNPKAVIMTGIAFGKDSQKQAMGDVLVSSQVAYYGIQAVRGDGTVQHRGEIVPCGDALLDRFRHTRSWAFEHLDGTKCKVRTGQILSGPILLDNAELKAQLFKAYPYAIGGEMEAVGVYEAASELHTEWIVVKAICDWGDGSKSDNFQDLAAASAASLVHDVLAKFNALEDIERPIISSSNAILPITADSSSTRQTEAEIINHIGFDILTEPQPMVQKSWETPGGIVDVNSKLYINRNIYKIVYGLLQQQGKTLIIKGSRQMGKSSLLLRALRQAEKDGKQVVSLDFSLLDHDTMADRERFFHEFCGQITDALNIDDRVEDFWDAERSVLSK